jgi:hypothetical protein
MRHSRFGWLTRLFVVTVAASLTVAAPPAYAHTHPTPVELDSPGVVYVETRARVEISLIEHNRHGKHIGLIQRTYEPLLATGSGFAVDPVGDIVTSGLVVRPNLDRARIYAVNLLFHERYGQNAPVPADPFSRQSIADISADPRTGRLADPINQRLQRCYHPNTADTTGGCVVSVTPVVRVFPYVASQQESGTLSATVEPGSTAEVAVLKVGATSMPTVNLGPSSAGAKAVAVLGFTGVPSPARPMNPKPAYAHLTQPGSKITQDKDLAALEPLLRDGYRGGPIVAEAGQVIGFFATPQPKSGETASSATLVDASAIRSVLKAVNVTPRRGPTDTAFENAMHSFKNNQFAASIPSFQNTVKLYPGHFIAAANLRTAQAKAGTAEDKTEIGAFPRSAAGGGRSGLLWALNTVAALMVVLAVAASLMLRRRRQKGGDIRKAASAGEPAPALDGERSPAVAVGASQPSEAADGRSRRPATSSVQSSASGLTATPAGTALSASPSQRATRAPDANGPDARNADARGRPQPSQRKASAMSPPQAAGGPAAAAGAAADSAQRFCTSCGGRLARHHRFCGWCGEEVG